MMFVYVSLLSLPFFSQPADAVFTGCLLFTRCASRGTRLSKKPGTSSVNGSGTCAWSWAISLSQLRCAPPSLLLPSRLSHCTRLLPRAMLPLRWACPGKRAASLVKTFLSSQMGRCAVPLARSFVPMSNAEKPMGACAWSMGEVTVVAVPVPCASSVNGRAAQPRSRAR